MRWNPFVAFGCGVVLFLILQDAGINIAIAWSSCLIFGVCYALLCQTRAKT